MVSVLESRPTTATACDAPGSSEQQSILYLSQHGPTQCKHNNSTGTQRSDILTAANLGPFRLHATAAPRESRDSHTPQLVIKATVLYMHAWCEKSLGHRQRSLHVAKLGKPRPDSCSPLAGVALRLARPCRATLPNPQLVRTAQVSWILLARDRVRRGGAWVPPSGEQLTGRNRLGAGVPLRARPRSPARPLVQKANHKKARGPSTNPTPTGVPADRVLSTVPDYTWCQ